MSSQETFHYRALTSKGTVITGSAPGESVRQVARDLKRQGLIPVQVGDGPQAGRTLKIPKIRVNGRRAVVQFLAGMSTLLNAGMPLDRALSMTANGAQSDKFRRALHGILSLVKSGKTLSESLAACPEYFSGLHVNMLKAGELGGSLASVFERLSQFEKSRGELRSYLISALLYPALLTTAGLLSILLLLRFVAPRFAAVFESSHVAMPMPMLVLLECNKLLTAYGPLSLAVLLAAIVVHFAYISTPRGRLWWDSLLLKMPLFGAARRKAETSRFARAMGVLVGNGVPLVQSIATARSVLRNERIALSLEGVSQSVKRGEGIAAPFARCGEFPALAGHLLAMGEETGNLDAMFIRMADIYESETRAAITRFTALFEPLIILTVGMAVGAIILSMLIAITSINDVAGL